MMTAHKEIRALLALRDTPEAMAALRQAAENWRSPPSARVAARKTLKAIARAEQGIEPLDEAA